MASGGGNGFFFSFFSFVRSFVRSFFRSVGLLEAAGFSLSSSSVLGWWLNREMGKSYCHYSKRAGFVVVVVVVVLDS